MQAAYPGTNAARDAEWVRWITEGTAEVVARAAAARLDDVSDGSSAYFRYLDQPLHIPPTTDRRAPEFYRWAYGSAEFFAFLGEALASRDGIQYLHELMTRLEPDGRNGLTAVEATLRTQGRSLYELYPEFGTEPPDQAVLLQQTGHVEPE